MQINQQALIEIIQSGELDIIPAEAKSLLIGLFSDGLQGLMDAAVVNNIDKLPPFLRDIVAPYLLEVDWNSVPQKISDMFNSFFREGGSGLTSTVGRLLGGLDLSNFNLGEFLSGIDINIGGFNLSFSGIKDAISAIAEGGFGGVTQLLSDFGGIDLLSLIPGSGIIKTASTIAGILFGGGDILGNLFGNGGFGISSILNILGVSGTITGLIGPILNLFGFGGGTQNKCPCDPSCRKTDHFITEKEQELLKEEKCETVIANSSSSYFSSGGIPDPSQTNGNFLSAALGLIETGLGKTLIPQNIMNLTAAILELPRMDKLGRQSQGAQNADWPDFINEYSYSMKTIEHGFKVADNNITGIENILKVFLDGQFFDDLFEKRRDDQVLETLSDTAMAVREIYQMLIALDGAKMGAPVVGASPAIAVKKMIKSHADLVKERKLTWASHLKKIKQFLELALALWKLLQPGRKGDNAPFLDPEEGSEDVPLVSTPFSEEELDLGTGFFEEDFYQKLSLISHTDDENLIDDIYQELLIQYEALELEEEESEVDEVLAQEYPAQYQETLNRLIRDRLNENQPGRLTRSSRYSQGGTQLSDVFDPRSPVMGSTPTASDSRRLSVTPKDLEKLAGGSSSNEFNALVKKLLDEQAAITRRKENC